VLRRAVVDAGLNRDGRRLRFHDLRHTFASHLIIDMRLDVAQDCPSSTKQITGCSSAASERKRRF
jgi:integrase